MTDNDDFTQRNPVDSVDTSQEPEAETLLNLTHLINDMKQVMEKLEDLEALLEEVLGKLDDLETPYTGGD